MICRRCKATMETTMTSLEGRAGNTALRVFQYPYNRCPQCTSRAFVEPDFNMYLLDAISDAVPAADVGGLRRQSSCSRCHADLVDATASPGLLEVTIEVRGRGLRVEVSAPGFGCPSCGLRQLQGGRRTVGSNLAEALMPALDVLNPIYSWKAS